MSQRDHDRDRVLRALAPNRAILWNGAIPQFVDVLSIGEKQASVTYWDDEKGQVNTTCDLDILYRLKPYHL